MRALVRIVFGVIALAVVAAGVGYLALRRGDIPYATLEQTYANAQSKYQDLPGGLRMHYRDEGRQDGPALLLVHGYSASLHTWAPLIPRLGDTYRLISIDLPGHGLTRASANYHATMDGYVNDVEAFAKARGLTTFTIAGSSMGGHVAWEYALAHPERLDGLILVDAAGWPPESDANPPLVFKLLQNPLARTALRDLDATTLIRGALRNSFANPALVDDAMVARYVDQGRAPGHRKILMDLQSPDARRFASSDVLGAIKTPTLILWGENDNLVPVGSAQRFAAAIPGAELVTWPNVGHVPQEEKPDETAEAIGAFLARNRARLAAQTVTTP